jgi:hypothetical protein
MTAPVVIAASRNKTFRTVVLTAGLLVVFTPVLVVGEAVSVLSQSAQACTTGGEVEQPAGGRPGRRGPVRSTVAVASGALV